MALERRSYELRQPVHDATRQEQAIMTQILLSLLSILSGVTLTPSVMEGDLSCKATSFGPESTCYPSGVVLVWTTVPPVTLGRTFTGPPGVGLPWLLLLNWTGLRT